MLLPVGLLAWIYAGPFLSLWIGDVGWATTRRESCTLMRLFLIAAIPLVLSVPVQMSIGINKIKVIALAALAGSLVNLPISCYLTARLGVAGVIWGTVLTTLFSNLLVPGIYVFRVLEIEPRTYLRRTLGAPMAGAAPGRRRPGYCDRCAGHQRIGRRVADDAVDPAPRRRDARLHRRLSARPRRPRRPGRAGRQAAAAIGRGSLDKRSRSTGRLTVRPVFDDLSARRLRWHSRIFGGM